MSFYIPTISKCLKNYPFLKKTFRKDYYRFKEIPDAIYDSLSVKSQTLYLEIKDKKKSKRRSIDADAAIVWSIVGFILCLIGFFGRILAE